MVVPVYESTCALVHPQQGNECLHKYFFQPSQPLLLEHDGKSGNVYIGCLQTGALWVIMSL